MEFVLSRTSAYRSDNVDELKIDDKKYKVKIKKIVYKNKKEDMHFDVIVIEINSLEELMEFQKDYGDIVILDYDYDYDKNLKEIEIYDDYRE